MAILDTLTVAIELNADMFTSGVKKATEGLEKVHETVGKSTDTLVDAGKKGADTFASFRREAMGAFALFSGGLGVPAFAGAMAQANTALASLSRQLDIAPQKLYQLHNAAQAAGVNAGDVDSLFKGVQNKYADSATRGQLLQMSAYLGISPVDKNGHARSDLLDQIAHSKTFQGSSRAVQDKYLEAFGGSSSLNNLLSRKDYDQLQKRFEGLGPTPEQIKQGEQLLADWQELKANTDQVMQQVFSDLEPSIHNFLQALIELEKAHPKEIAEGVTAIAGALSLLSAILTAKSFLRVIGMLTGIGGGGAIGSGLIAGATRAAGPLGLAYAAFHPHEMGTGDDYDMAHRDPSSVKLVHNSGGNIDLDRLTGAVAMQESGGNPNAVNTKTGAAGMLQFMPATARENGVSNPFDPDQAWAGGRRYLERLMARYHDQRKALAAYNWGMGNLDKDMRTYGDNWQSYLPHETSDYLAKVGRNYETGNVVHHHNNTNAPNVSVVINGANKNAHEIAQEVSRSIPQQTAQDDSTRVM